MKVPRPSDLERHLGFSLAALSRVATTVPFRLAVAAVCLSFHLFMAVRMGRDRFQVPFNAAPGKAPQLANPATDPWAQGWDRLVVSRWDAGAYVTTALRRFTQCPDKDLRNVPLKPLMGTCNVAFYPGYSLLGWYASGKGRIPIDYALLAISLVSSFVLLFLWTGPALRERLGLSGTYVSLAVFNAFTTAFTLVTVQSEPAALALTFGAFVALTKRHYLLGALLAGGATGMRFAAISVGVAYGLALVVLTVLERPQGVRAWIKRGAEMVLSGWGVLALMLYFRVRFHDALLYIRGHSEAFKRDVGFLALWRKSHTTELIRSLEYPLHEGVWLVAALVWFLLGRKEALDTFKLPQRVFWYTVFVLSIAIPAVGQVHLSFAGMNRYLLLALPLFFAMGAVMKRRPALVALWLCVSLWHYWNVDLCQYTGGPGDRTLERCHAKHWVGERFFH